MRLRDRMLGRGPKARKANLAEPKRYPLQTGEWSSCDESSDDESGEAAAKKLLPDVAPP